MWCVLIVVSTSVWVYFDAKKIGVKKGLVKGLADLSPLSWFLVCLGFWFVSFPIYIVNRGKFKRLLTKGTQVTDKPDNPPDGWKSFFKYDLLDRRFDRPLTSKELVIVLIVILMIAAYFHFKNSDNISIAQKPLPTREDKIRQQFSEWDGSHRKLDGLIKKSMNDPSSYEHVESRYWDKGDHLVVVTEFRGKNVFGAKVKNRVKAKVNIEDGAVLEIVENGP